MVRRSPAELRLDGGENVKRLALPSIGRPASGPLMFAAQIAGRISAAWSAVTGVSPSGGHALPPLPAELLADVSRLIRPTHFK